MAVSNGVLRMSLNLKSQPIKSFSTYSSINAATHGVVVSFALTVQFDTVDVTDLDGVGVLKDRFEIIFVFFFKLRFEIIIERQLVVVVIYCGISYSCLMWRFSLSLIFLAIYFLNSLQVVFAEMNLLRVLLFSRVIANNNDDFDDGTVTDDGTVQKPKTTSPASTDTY